MAKIVLISCASKKLSRPARAENLYVSPLFQYNLKYARSLHADRIFILSAKYGLVHLGKKIKPYNKTLNAMPAKQIKAWAETVIENLKRVSDLKMDEFIFLAGEKYRRNIIPHIVRFRVPFQGLSIGRQLKYLKSRTGR
jgi:hypothetical protein